MRSIEIPFGKSKLFVQVPEKRLNAVIRPNHNHIMSVSQKEVVLAALANPIGTRRLCELARNKQRVLIITSDHTRPVPSDITMPLLLDEIRRNNPEVLITLLIATGMHRSTTEAELLERFGDEIVDNESIVVHNASSDEDMTFFGTLPSGGELWLNKLVKENDLVISEGFIEPHFFAGFSGGRKSILPGVASRKTVLYNHNAHFIANPNARQGSLDENPIHKDMLFAANQAKLAFILNVIIDTDKKVVAAVAGDHKKAHLAGCVLCEKMARVEKVVSDIVITSNGGYPLDQNIYQSVKGMTAAESCIRQGGAIIMCAALGDGHGGEDFYRWFADRPNAETVMRDIEGIPPEETSMDQWQAQILARVMSKATCWIVTSVENRELIETMHMKWAPDVKSALAEATVLLGEDSTVTVIPDGVGVII
ncbi:MAG: nickel-dependent lactate racemase [Clostridiaceae bacterium]|nr:nickel-dependent lactate racemase [Clostridiaceae bacterium]